MNEERIPLRRHSLGHVECYEVTADELDRIERDASDLGTDFQIGSIALTLSLSFIANILLTTITDRRIYTFFVVIIVSGFLFGVAHLYKWYKHRNAFSTIIQRIRDRQIGPVGEEGKELMPSDLVDMQSSEPTTKE